MNNIEILERLEQMQQIFREDGLQGYEMAIVTAKKLINNLIQENKELRIQISARETVVDKLTKENKELKKQMGKDLDVVYIKGVYDERDKWKNKIKEKIEELDKRIDYLDKELAEAYIQREKLGTETELDANEQYIYTMEQERSIRHTEKYAYLKLLEEGVDIWEHIN